MVSEVHARNANMVKVVFGSKPAGTQHSDIMDYFLSHQSKYEISSEILVDERQPMLNWKMRALLLDWMMEVSAEFKLRRETFYLGVNYLDRYVLKVPHIHKRDYQLIGTAALYLACKMEEISIPKISYFIIATDRGYSHKQILNMERDIAMELEWNLTPSSIETWMRL
jgi:hypothetical protein